MSTNGKVRVLLYGAGGWAAARHWAAFGENRDLMEPAGIIDLPDGIARFWEENNVPIGSVKVYTEEEALADASIDAFLLATRSDLHVPQGINALDAGKHVFFEKPVITHYSQMRPLQEAIERNPTKKTSVNLSIRFYPLHDDMDKILKRGELGDLVYLRGTSNHMVNTGLPALKPGDKVDPDRPETWSDRRRWKLFKRYSGGAVAMCIMHAIDYMCYLAEPKYKVTHVSAQSWPSKVVEQYDHDTVYSIILEFEDKDDPKNRIYAHVAGDTTSPTGYNFLVQVHGTKGEMTLNTLVEKRDEYRLYIKTAEDEAEKRPAKVEYWPGRPGATSGKVEHHNFKDAQRAWLEAILNDTQPELHAGVGGAPYRAEEITLATDISAALDKLGDDNRVYIGDVWDLAPSILGGRHVSKKVYRPTQ